MAPGSRIDRCDMRDAIDDAGAQQLRSDPARKAARATVSPERVFDRMTDICGFEPPNALMVFRGKFRNGRRQLHLHLLLREEGAGLRERRIRSGARLRFEEAVGVPSASAWRRCRSRRRGRNGPSPPASALRPQESAASRKASELARSSDMRCSTSAFTGVSSSLSNARSLVL